jgi:hypothetical protein
MTDIKELSKYLFSVAKLSSDEAGAVATIEVSLRDLANAQIGLATAIVNHHAGEWGETARCTKHTCADIAKRLTEHIKK